MICHYRIFSAVNLRIIDSFYKEWNIICCCSNDSSSIVSITNLLIHLYTIIDHNYCYSYNTWIVITKILGLSFSIALTFLSMRLFSKGDAIYDFNVKMYKLKCTLSLQMYKLYFCNTLNKRPMQFSATKIFLSSEIKIARTELWMGSIQNHSQQKCKLPIGTNYFIYYEC